MEGQIHEGIKTGEQGRCVAGSLFGGIDLRGFFFECCLFTASLQAFDLVDDLLQLPRCRLERVDQFQCPEANSRHESQGPLFVSQESGKLGGYPDQGRGTEAGEAAGGGQRIGVFASQLAVEQVTGIAQPQA